MLEDNALLLRNLLKLYRISDDDLDRRYIDFTIEYLDAWLSDPVTGAFFGSQDADEEFYPLSGEERKKHPAPYVAKTVYTSWNAMAISAYLEASWARGKPHLRDRAIKALDFLFDTLHTETEGMHRYLAPEGRRIGGLLGDQAWTAMACLDAYEVTGRPQDLERAKSLAALMVDRLADDAGGFFDTPRGHDALGRLSMRQKPVKENAVAAEVLTRLARLTHDSAYEETARRTLLQFTNVVEAQGYFAAAYAKSVDVFLNPGAEVKIVASGGDGAEPLHAAALSLLVPDRTVRVLDAADRVLLERESLPPQPAPAAYVCYG